MNERQSRITAWVLQIGCARECTTLRDPCGREAIDECVRAVRGGFGDRPVRL